MKQQINQYEIEPIQSNLKVEQKKIDARLNELAKADY